jgi:excisionase family DNA binding protein
MTDSEWLSLRRAAEILGVHPATVRNWADRGDLASSRTPGGHRRFRRADLMRVAQIEQPLEVQLIIQNALGQARMQVGEGALEQTAWYRAMSANTLEQMRHAGRRTLEDLRAYLANGSDAELARAITLGKDYAAMLSRDGVGLPDALRGFFYFSEFVTNAVLTWGEVTPPHSPAEWGALLRQVNTFVHAMLLSIVEYYEEE